MSSRFWWGAHGGDRQLVPPATLPAVEDLADGEADPGFVGGGFDDDLATDAVGLDHASDHQFHGSRAYRSARRTCSAGGFFGGDPVHTH